LFPPLRGVPRKSSITAEALAIRLFFAKKKNEMARRLFCHSICLKKATFFAVFSIVLFKMSGFFFPLF